MLQQITNILEGTRLLLVLLGILGALWGSFLNVVAYRLIHNQTPFHPRRSYCPACKKTLHWYELIPIISFILLRGACSNCKTKISPLYLFLELLTAGIFVYYGILFPVRFLPATLVFASLLIITIRTDFEDRSIFRIVTLFSLPFVYICSSLNLIPISFIHSFIASISAYILLRIIRFIAYLYAKHEALGLGDVELISFIGGIGGLWSTWSTLILGSLFGIIHGTIISVTTKSYDPRIPFGSYLAIAQLILWPIAIKIFLCFFQ